MFRSTATFRSARSKSSSSWYGVIRPVRYATAWEPSLTSLAVMEAMFSAIVIAVFGSLEVAGPGDPGAMAAAIQDALPTSSKLLRFKGMAHVGPFGSDSRVDYTFLQPAFPRFLATFLEMSFGEFRVA